MIQWNPDILNADAAPGIAAFDVASITDIRAEFPKHQYWVIHFFQNQALARLGGKRFEREFGRRVFELLRRVQLAFLAYHEARRLTLDYLDGVNPLNPNLYQYFAAAAEWENFSYQTNIAMGVYNRLGPDNRAFERDDGSKEQRVNEIANNIKHAVRGAFGEPDPDPGRDGIPLWLSNDGINSFGGARVLYDEMANLLRAFAKLADEYENPRNFATR